MVSGIKRKQHFEGMSESCQIYLYLLSYFWDLSSPVRLDPSGNKSISFLKSAPATLAFSLVLDHLQLFSSCRTCAQAVTSAWNALSSLFLWLAPSHHLGLRLNVMLREACEYSIWRRFPQIIYILPFCFIPSLSLSHMHLFDCLFAFSVLSTASPLVLGHS